MKRSELTISVLLIPLDYAALLAAAALAYTIRFTQLAALRPVTFHLPFPEFFRLSAAVALGWIIILALAGCYAATARRRWPTEFRRVLLGVTTAFGLTLAAIVFSRDLFDSRFIILASWILAASFIIIIRLAVRAIERVLFAAGIGVHRLALIGEGRAADALATAFEARPGLGFRIAVRYPLFDATVAQALATAWEHQTIDEVIEAATPPNPAMVHALLDFCAEHHIPIRYSADFLTAHAPRISIETFAGVPLVEVHQTRLLGWGGVFKRIFDIKVAVILLIVTAPIALLIAIAIKIDSRGPIIFRQKRIGRAGRPFDFLKFRSMREGAHAEWAELRQQSERSGILPKIKDDPRVTRVGRFLRRWSLDELPQFWNVLTGTMSLVGPRPHLPEEVAEYERHHKIVLAVRPGITGLAQVSGRSDLDFEEEVKIDTYYVENWSPALDIVILLRTPFAVFRKRGAY
ncbi:MAG: sugar transferase [Candidatus Uhrbacteria bacterium]